jgi:hypothetical protein
LYRFAMKEARPLIRGGEDVAWNFADVELGRRRYNFLVTEWRLTAYRDDLRGELGSFGHALEDAGSVVHAYPERRNQARRQVVDLAWSSVDGHLADCVNTELAPFVLIVGRDFDGFDPGSHGWAIVWLPAQPDMTQVRQGFARLARDTLSSVDLFEGLRAIAERRRETSPGTRGFAFSNPDRAAVELADIVTPP